MKKIKIIITYLFITLFAIFNANDIMAMGAGYDVHLKISHINLDGVSNNQMIGIGSALMFDTAVVVDSLFNYRIYINYTNYSYNKIDSIHELKINNVFGFGLIRKKKIRLFLGPEFGVGYIGNFKEIGTNYLSHNISAVLGLNININDKFIITNQVSYGFIMFTGNHKDPDALGFYIPGFNVSAEGNFRMGVLFGF